MDTQLLIAALVFIVPMCFTPGPNNILCAAHGSQYGFRNTLPLIMGMAIGWSTLGLFVGGATVFIEKNQSFFDALTVVGAIYIAYLGYKVWQSSPMSDDEKESTRLGIKTGTTIQVVNGKAWIHFLVLMTQFGTIFGTTFAAKAMLVFLNLVFGLPAVMSWAAFGTQLRKLFSTPKSARVLNRIMGSSLVVVAIWIVI
ncbi:LysE family translocator [Euryarchaeota archaeon]|nr:LysE family translocator [Euryarchaeota archaeon]